MEKKFFQFIHFSKSKSFVAIFYFIDLGRAFLYCEVKVSNRYLDFTLNFYLHHHQENSTSLKNKCILFEMKFEIKKYSIYYIHIFISVLKHLSLSPSLLMWKFILHLVVGVYLLVSELKRFSIVFTTFETVILL